MTEASSSAMITSSLIQIVGGAWLSRSIAAAARLGIADLVAAAPRGVAELAAEIGANADVLARLMSLLAACGIFVEDENGRFSNSALSALLRTDHERSLRHFCMLAGGEYTDAFGKLLHSVTTGESAFPAAFGGSIYDYMDRTPEFGRVYDLAMRELAQPVGQQLARRREFAVARLVIDVGGGDGAALARILDAHPHLQGVSADRADVCKRGEANLDPTLKGRLSFAPTDFLVEVPAGDVYILKNVLHNWSDERCLAILATITRAMSQEHGRLLILEPLIEPDDRSPRNLMDALLQAVICESGACARSEAQLRGLVIKAGFVVEEVFMLPTGHGVIVCRRPA